MSRVVIVTVAVLVVLAGVSLPALGMEATASTTGDETVSTQTETTATDATNGSAGAAPGTRLAGVVGVQGAELGGELESRSFGYQLNRSATNDSKAAVLARQTNRSERRLAALRSELTRLEAARENGSISESAYRVRAVQLSARIAAVRRVTDRTAATAGELPDETLRRNGVSVTALQSLRTTADDLTGPEMAAIARDIAGPRVGTGFGPSHDRNRTRGPPANPGADARGNGGDRGANGESEGSPGASGENARAGGSQSRADDDRNSTRHENATATANEPEPQKGGNDRGSDQRGNGPDNRPSDPGKSGEARTDTS